MAALQVAIQAVRDALHGSTHLMEMCHEFYDAENKIPLFFAAKRKALIALQDLDEAHVDIAVDIEQMRAADELYNNPPSFLPPRVEESVVEPASASASASELPASEHASGVKSTLNGKRRKLIAPSCPLSPPSSPRPMYQFTGGAPN